MTNCLSSSRFANLLFVNVQIGDVRSTALFDTGACMTVIAQSLLQRLRTAPEKEVLRAGNNNGVVRTLQTAVIPNIQFMEEYTMKNSALVVIDLQNDITKNYKKIIAKVNKAIDWAEQKELWIVYIQHNNLSAGTRTFKHGTRGAELLTYYESKGCEVLELSEVVQA